MFGVDYAWARGKQGGEMWFTRDGWSIADTLLPAHWFDNAAYRRPGHALAGATGRVYKLPLAHPQRKGYSAVVKFSRFSQSVGVTCVDAGLEFGWSSEELLFARFSDPFSEFGHVTALKAAAGHTLLLKRPLAIYSPPQRYLEWQLGREDALRYPIERRIAADQQSARDCPPTALYWDRIYIMLYQWLDGIDLGEAATRGELSVDDAKRLASVAANRLLAAGYAVFDHKLCHVIIKRTRKGQWLRRNGELALGLVDYELLMPYPTREALCQSSAAQ